LAELSNLFRTVDMGLVSLEHALNYSLLPRRLRAPVAFIDFLGLDVEYASIRYLCSHYGDRFYVSQVLEDKVKKKELGQKTGQGFLDHSQGLAIYDLVGRKPDRKYQSSIKTVYINELQIQHTNLLVQLLNINKQVWFKSTRTPFWELLARINPSLFHRLAAQCFYSKEGVPGRCDLVIDCPPLADQYLLTERVAALQDSLGEKVPIILNIPLYKIEDIAGKAKDTSLIFGMNSMRSYLSSVELVRVKKGNPIVYEDLKEFVGELSGQCIEVADGPTRPLVFMQLAKMFETVRVLEEQVAEKQAIEKLLMTDSVFKDMDFLGLDNLVYLARSLYAIYGVPFVVPAGLKEMLQQGWLGVRVGKGFESYPPECKK
jgi:3-hydroxyacyl-CoA dehydrogenase